MRKIQQDYELQQSKIAADKERYAEQIKADYIEKNVESSASGDVVVDPDADSLYPQ
jgi:hypothetical protein